MAGKTITMSILRQILGLHLLGTPLLRIAEAVKVSRNTVRKYIRQIEKNGHSLEELSSMAKEQFYALEDFGGVARALVPDNMKTAVTTASNYEPLVDRDFIDLANHYGATVIPARSRKPRDKAIVENAVSIVYSRIFAPLRDDTFHSLESLKRAVRDRLEVYNAMPFQQRPGSRKSVFEQEEKAHLKPLPAERFERRTYKELTVMKNGHVLLYEDRHYYSVPYRYIGKKVRLIYSARHVSVYFQHERIAYHPRNKKRNGYSTIKDHLSSTHRFVSDWNADRFIAWAGAIAPEVREYITRILDDAPHPEQAYKSCVGILSQDRKVGRERLIRAVKRAILYGAYNYTTIRKILQSGLDNLEPEQEEKNSSMPGHQNIRGPQAYQ
jgi:hypothetical protein